MIDISLTDEFLDTKFELSLKERVHFLLSPFIFVISSLLDSILMHVKFTKILISSGKALPEDIKILVNLTCIRIESSKLLITKIKGDNKKCTLSLSDNSNLVSKNSSVREISINYPEKIYSKSEFLLNKLKSFSN